MAFDVDPPYTRSERRVILAVLLLVLLCGVLYGMLFQHEVDSSSARWRAEHPARLSVLK